MSIKELNPPVDFMKTDIHALGISFIHLIGGSGLLRDYHTEPDSEKLIEKMIRDIPSAIVTQCAARGFSNDVKNLLLGMTAINQAVRIPTVGECLKNPVFKKFGNPIPGKINPGRPLTENQSAMMMIEKLKKVVHFAKYGSLFAFAEQIAKRITGLGIARNETELVAMAFFGAMQITGLYSYNIINRLNADRNWISGEGFPETVAALKGILVTPVQVA
jgi:hypothetical protein